MTKTDSLTANPAEARMAVELCPVAAASVCCFCSHGCRTDQQAACKQKLNNADPLVHLSLGSNSSLSLNNEGALHLSEPATHRFLPPPPSCALVTPRPNLCSSSSTGHTTETPTGALSIQFPCCRVSGMRQHEDSPSLTGHPLPAAPWQVLAPMQRCCDDCIAYSRHGWKHQPPQQLVFSLKVATAGMTPQPSPGPWLIAA
jgi:hypothetical protein